MFGRICLVLSLMTLFFLALLPPLPACCPAYPRGKPVVNADQTVIIIWDAATQTQHFIRKASFTSAADDFGFLIPTPSEPELSESGNEAFPHLQKLTEPEKEKRSRGDRSGGNVGCGCSSKKDRDKAAAGKVEDSARVLQDKIVAGFRAVTLEATTVDALTDWLKKNEYTFSPEVAAWAKPYIEQNWKITALKVVKAADGKEKPTVAADSLRLSFKTPKPLFPYREPDSTSDAGKLGAKARLLRIYFIAEGRHRGELTKEQPWTGKVAWANKISAEDRKQLLTTLKLPENTGPAEWWLTEFEDNWPYKVAPADVFFSRDDDQSPVKREPIVEWTAGSWPTDVTAYALAVVLFVPVVLRRRKRLVSRTAD